MAISQYDNVVIGEVSGDAGQSDGCNDGILEIVGPPGTNIGCMLATNSEWAVLIPANTLIPADGVFLIACSSDPTGNCGVGLTSSTNGLIANGVEGDFTSGFISEIDLDVCNSSNSTFYDPAATGFTIDNSSGSDGDQIMLFRPNGTPHDGVYWGTSNMTSSGATTVGGSSGNADHVTITISGQTYTLGDNDGDGIVNNNPTSVANGRGDGGDATAVPLLPTSMDCPCNTPSSPGTFTIPSLDDPSGIWFNSNVTTPNLKGCNSSIIRLDPGTSAGGQNASPSHTDGEVEDSAINPNGSNMDSGSAPGITGDFGETTITSEGFTPSSYTPTSCGDPAAEWSYTDHPTPGQANDDPTFVFYASTDQQCTVGDMVTFTVEIYNYQNVSDNTDVFSGTNNEQTGSYVFDPITGSQVTWDTYTVSAETTTMTYTTTLTSTGTFDFGLVWDDFSNCCGTTGLPNSQASPNECYETETITVEAIEPMRGMPSFTCENGQVNVNVVPSNATGLTYELLDQSTYSVTGGNVVQSNTTGQFLITSPASNNYFVRVSQKGDCSGPFEAIGTICVFSPPCPEFIAYATCTSNEGAFCPGSVIDISVEGMNLTPGSIIEFVSLSDGDLDPYDNPGTDVLASCTIPDPTIVIGTSNMYLANDDNFFAFQDIDGEGAASTQTMIISGIDIVGQTGLSLCIDLAEDDGLGWDTSDDFDIDISIDGGPSETLIEIAGTATNTTPVELISNTNLTNTFTTFSSNISNTGSTADIIITMMANSGNEDLAFDNLIIKSNENPSGLYTLDFDANNSGYTLSIPQFSDGNSDYFGVVSTNNDNCKSIPVAIELCGNLNIAPRIATSQSGCNMSTGGNSEQPTLTPLVYTIECPSATITAGAFDVCLSDMGTVDIPVTLTGLTSGTYRIGYQLDGGAEQFVTAPGNSSSVNISISGPTSGEVKVTLSSVFNDIDGDSTEDTADGECSGTINDAEVCVNIRPTPTGTVDNKTDPTNCMPCDGMVTFTFIGNGPFDFEYTINGGAPLSVGAVSSPYTLIGACPGVYDIVSISDENSCPGTIISNPMTLAAPSGTPLTVTTQPAAVCNDATGSVDLTADVTYDPAYSAADFFFFGVDPNGLPIDVTDPSTFTGFTIASTYTVPADGTTVFALYIDPMSGCPSVASVVVMTSADACFTCPMITTLSDPEDPCNGGSFDLTVSGLDADLMNQNSGGGRFGIEFRAIAGTITPADAYVAMGTSLGIVANGALTNAGTEATVTGVGGALAPGDYQVCAILSDSPTDIMCRPQVCVSVTVNSVTCATFPWEGN
jgi:hypothetical protein